MTTARTDEEDIQALAKGGRTNVFGFMLRLAARIPFLFIAGRLYGPEALGRFAYAILIVEFANQLRAGGMSALDAVHRSATLRLRPILMTTGAMVLGAIPLALATGAGSESRRQIGWVIVGGMSFGTLLTVFVVPTMYSLFARKKVPGPNKNDVSGEPPESAHAH